VLLGSYLLGWPLHLSAALEVIEGPVAGGRRRGEMLAVVAADGSHLGRWRLRDLPTVVELRPVWRDGIPTWPSGPTAGQEMFQSRS